MGRMHADEVDIDAELVRRLVRGQFPWWADLPVERFGSGGTVNAIFRLGAELSVRLPLTAGGAGDLAREARWLPRLAPALPVAVPRVLAGGAPAEGYPYTWAVYRWIAGEPPIEGGLAAPERVAADLAGLVTAMRAVDLPDGPPAHRATPLAGADEETRAAIDAVRRTDEPFDADAATAAWNEALAVPEAADSCWIHSDLMPSNLLLTGDRLTAVLDFGTVGLGDPACDLIPAWNLLPAAGRAVFRDAVAVDGATWARGRGWALSMALIQLPYYRKTNPVISANARYVIREVLASEPSR